MPGRLGYINVGSRVVSEVVSERYGGGRGPPNNSGPVASEMEAFCARVVKVSISACVDKVEGSEGEEKWVER